MANKPFYKNPWIWTFIVGAAILTLARPFFVHQPKAPPALFQLPSLKLSHTQDSSTLIAIKNRIHFLFVFDPQCSKDCTLNLMHKLAQRYNTWPKKMNVDLLGLSSKDLSHQTDSSRIKLVQLNHSDLLTFINNGLQLTKLKIPLLTKDLEAWKYLVLVDHKGALRGIYPINPEGLDEAFHRAILVWLEKH